MVNKAKFKIGIYIIVNIVNDKMYVGSSKNISSRFSEHRLHLRQQKHHSILLQRAINKYDIENFRFCRIEEVLDTSKLLEREQYYIDILKPEYNICKKAGHGIISENMEKGRKEFLIRNGGGVFKGGKKARTFKNDDGSEQSDFWKAKKYRR